MNPQHTPLQSAPVLQTALAHRSIRKFTGAPIAPEQLAAIRAANGEEAYEAPVAEAIDIPLIIDEESMEQPQTPMPELPAATRKLSFVEVELGFTPEEAMKEACRCLRCDAEV